MALDYVSTSKQLVEAVGGAENIASATHCMTRLRLILKNESKADDAKVKAVKGVKSVIKQGGQYQIVIGNEVSNLFKEFSRLGNFTENDEKVEKADGNVAQRMMGFVAGCMTPLLPAMLGTGMVKVLITILTTCKIIEPVGSTYEIIYGMADSFFYFLPLFLSAFIAKKMHKSQPLFMVIGAMFCYPNIVSLMAGTLESAPLGTFLGMPATSLFGIPVITATYTSSVLPILLMAPVMAWAEDFADRISPNVLKAFLKPMIFLLICTPIAFCILGPIGGVIGNVLSGAFEKMYNAVPWLTVGILSAIMPFIVMTGMHYALIPLCMNNMATLGYDVIVMVTMFCSNLAQGGAALGVAVKAKDTETKSESFASAVSAIVAGITEPAMYGINFRFGAPMVAACIGAGISGLFTGITGVKGYTMGGSPSMFSLITFIGGEGNPYLGVIMGSIGLAISVGVSFFLTLLLFREKKNENTVSAETTSEETVSVEMTSGNLAEEVKEALVKKIELAAPMAGKVMDLKEVPDEAFASGALGEGVAILPVDGNVYAPADGKVTTTMDTGHAIAITTEDGVELLIHVGLDTVSLNGVPFAYKVSEGETVKKGQLLMTADLAGIEAAGLKLHTPVLVINTDDFVSVKVVKTGDVTPGDVVLSVV